MKKILIIKTGTTFPFIREQYGDFEDFIINQADLPREYVSVVTSYAGEILPDIKDISAVIITGSHSMVTDNDYWCITLSKWLRDIACKSIPVLGICFGHQLLAHAFGGNVDYHPKGKEIGTVNIKLTPEGKKDPLLGVLPQTFLGHVTHAQTIISLPERGRILAENDFEPHHAFCINGNMWGVQFHPEFNANIIRAYIDGQKQELINQGYDLDKIYGSVQEHLYGKMLLKHFIELI